MSAETSDEQDWRLQAELAVADASGALRDVLARLRDGKVVEEIETSVPRDVVITHDGKLLFAYAADEDTLRQARQAIAQVLARDGIQAQVRIGHWDEDVGEWVQVDPPLGASERAASDRARQDAQAPETRTLVASSGKLVRREFEQTMREWAARLGLECEIVEHPHLLSTQVAFTVTGPHHKVEEFAHGLKAEEWATIRTELPVLTSPL